MGRPETVETGPPGTDELCDVGLSGLIHLFYSNTSSDLVE